MFRQFEKQRDDWGRGRRMSNKSSSNVRELAQLMTVPEILAALGGSVSRDTFYKVAPNRQGTSLFHAAKRGTALHRR